MAHFISCGANWINLDHVARAENLPKMTAVQFWFLRMLTTRSSDALTTLTTSGSTRRLCCPRRRVR